MSKTPLYSSDQIIKALQKCGFEKPKKSRRGSHLSLRKKEEGGTRVVVVPMGKKEIPRGTFANIVRQAGDEFLQWL